MTRELADLSKKHVSSSSHCLFACCNTTDTSVALSALASWNALVSLEAGSSHAHFRTLASVLLHWTAIDLLLPSTDFVTVAAD